MRVTHCSNTEPDAWGQLALQAPCRPLWPGSCWGLPWADLYGNSFRSQGLPLVLGCHSLWWTSLPEKLLEKQSHHTECCSVWSRPAFINHHQPGLTLISHPRPLNHGAGVTRATGLSMPLVESCPHPPAVVSTWDLWLSSLCWPQATRAISP